MQGKNEAIKCTLLRYLKLAGYCLLTFNIPFNIRHLLPTTPTRLHGIIAIFLQEGCSVVPSCMKKDRL